MVIRCLTVLVQTQHHYHRNGVVYGHVAHLTFVPGGYNLCPATIQHINVLSDTRVQNVRLNTEITFIFLHGIYSFHFCTFLYPYMVAFLLTARKRNSGGNTKSLCLKTIAVKDTDFKEHQNKPDKKLTFVCVLCL